MASLNTTATGHGNKFETYSTGLTVNYNVFLSGNAKDIARLNTIKQAMQIIDRLNNKIDLYGPCSTYFKSLPKGKTFSHFWNDSTIYVNFSPAITAGFYGATHSNHKDMCITAWCLDTHNKWMIAATIVHELAHVAGAPGGASHAAEKAADKCGFKPQYNPLIQGAIDKLGEYLERLA